MRIADQFLDDDYIDTGPKHGDKVGTESREVEYIYNGIEFPTEQEMHEYIQVNEAKRFTEKAAKKAAYFASKNGVNHWEIISINKN